MIACRHWLRRICPAVRRIGGGGGCTAVGRIRRSKTAGGRRWARPARRRIGRVAGRRVGRRCCCAGGCWHSSGEAAVGAGGGGIGQRRLLFGSAVHRWLFAKCDYANLKETKKSFHNFLQRTREIRRRKIGV
jgi:hypothetical protein